MKMIQKQKGLLKAKLIVEGDDLPTINRFVDHLSAKSHIAITERTDTMHTTNQGDYPRVHLSMERRACWGNWASDVRRDIAHSLKRSGSSAECRIVEVKRTVVETREGEARAETKEASGTPPREDSNKAAEGSGVSADVGAPTKPPVSPAATADEGAGVMASQVSTALADEGPGASATDAAQVSRPESLPWWQRAIAAARGRRPETAVSQSADVPTSSVQVERGNSADLDMYLVAKDHESTLADEIIAARDADAADTPIDSEGQQGDPEIEVAVDLVEWHGEGSSAAA
jgi:hypothetical protein